MIKTTTKDVSARQDNFRYVSGRYTELKVVPLIGSNKERYQLLTTSDRYVSLSELKGILSQELKPDFSRIEPCLISCNTQNKLSYDVSIKTLIDSSIIGNDFIYVCNINGERELVDLNKLLSSFSNVNFHDYSSKLEREHILVSEISSDSNRSDIIHHEKIALSFFVTQEILDELAFILDDDVISARNDLSLLCDHSLLMFMNIIKFYISNNISFPHCSLNSQLLIDHLDDISVLALIKSIKNGNLLDCHESIFFLESREDTVYYLLECIKDMKPFLHEMGVSDDYIYHLELCARLHNVYDYMLLMHQDNYNIGELLDSVVINAHLHESTILKIMGDFNPFGYLSLLKEKGCFNGNVLSLLERSLQPGLAPKSNLLTSGSSHLEALCPTVVIKSIATKLCENAVVSESRSAHDKVLSQKILEASRIDDLVKSYIFNKQVKSNINSAASLFSNIKSERITLAVGSFYRN